MQETTFNAAMARIAVGAYDDAQETRKSMINRVRDIIRKKDQGIPFDEVEDEKEENDFSEAYSDDKLPDKLEEMYKENKITQREYQYLEDMLEAGNQAAALENKYKGIFGVVEREPIYQEWLQFVNGVSTTLTARLLHQFGYCEDFDRVSHLWSYVGMTPDSKREKGEQLGFNPQAKKVAWLVADCMMKCGSKSKYRREFFDPYKEKQLKRMGRAEEMTEKQLEQKRWTPAQSQGHAHNRAMRYLAKKFLKHYWGIARDIKNLETPDEYIIAHGGREGPHDKEVETWENPLWAKQRLVERQ